MQENIKGLYAAFKAKDARFDGRFFVGISSTGIYCRPVCKARQPKQENIKGLYAAFKAKDARFDGRFFVGISSTGIYCRPVCKARQPKAENCTFFRTAAAAEQALPFVQAGTCSRDLCY